MLPASVFRAASTLRPAGLSLSQRFYSTKLREPQFPRIYGKWHIPPSGPNGVDANWEDEKQTLGWFVAESSPHADSPPYDRSIFPKFPISAPQKVRLPRMENPPRPAPRSRPVRYKDEMIRPPGPRRPIAPPDPDIKLFKAPLHGKETRRATIRAAKLVRDAALAEQWLDYGGHWQIFQDKIVEWEKFTGTKCQVGIPCPVVPPKRVPYREHRVANDQWKALKDEARRYKLKIY